MSFTSSNRILIVEPSALIAIDLSEALNQAGFEVVGPYRSCAEALEHVAGDISVATMSYHLADGTCEALVRSLRAYGVRCLIITGDVLLPRELSDLPRVNKPYVPEEVVSALRCLREQPAPRAEQRGFRTRCCGQPFLETGRWPSAN